MSGAWKLYLIKGITPKIRTLCFVLINSVILNLLCVWVYKDLDTLLTFRNSVNFSDLLRQNTFALS